jgi:hypothetical protein
MSKNTQFPNDKIIYFDLLHFPYAQLKLQIYTYLIQCVYTPSLYTPLRLSCSLLFPILRKNDHLRSLFKIPFYLVPPIVFSFRAKAFFYFGTIRRFSWNGTSVSHWRFHDNRRMNTSADVSKFKISPFSC